MRFFPFLPGKKKSMSLLFLPVTALLLSWLVCHSSESRFLSAQDNPCLVSRSRYSSNVPRFLLQKAVPNFTAVVSKAKYLSLRISNQGFVRGLLRGIRSKIFAFRRFRGSEFNRGLHASFEHVSEPHTCAQTFSFFVSVLLVQALRQ